jgi:cytochrome c biogenesis protein CcmG/thiol:disulfide interchange protein DsbE
MGTSSRSAFWQGLAADWGVSIGAAVLVWWAWTSLFSPAPLSEGPAPAFSLAQASGSGEIAVPGEAPKIVLNFWFTSCPPCRAEIPELAAFHAAHPELPLYGVSVDRMDPARLQRLADDLGVTYPVLHDADSQVASDYGVGLFPTTVVIEGGQITAVHAGAIDRDGLERLIR